MIRHATIEDSGRIAEISIFTKRVNYRDIFKNDKVTFGEMSVCGLAKEYIEHPEKLEGIWVYDDVFVKGFINIHKSEICELYVDSFFENLGIGSQLMRFAIKNKSCNHLWILEKNVSAKRFYKRFGFSETGNRRRERNTTEYIIELKR